MPTCFRPEAAHGEGEPHLVGALGHAKVGRAHTGRVALRARGRPSLFGRPGRRAVLDGRWVHCPCGGWSVTQELGGVVSDVREGYRRFGRHVRALCPALASQQAVKGPA